jgi:septum formation protein
VEGAQARVSAPPAPPLLLASTSPQRRAILEQLGLPFDVVAPRYEEHDTPDADPVALVRDHAQGKARSVAPEAGDRPVLGVDTTVVCGGRVYGKAGGPEDAAEMLSALGGATHEVVSGLCLLTPAWEELRTETTLVTVRALAPRELAHYVASGEWEGRAGAYAIQGLGGSIVSRLEGDYLNVVGLPGALLAQLLAERFPGVYGFG